MMSSRTFSIPIIILTRCLDGAAHHWYSARPSCGDPSLFKLHIVMPTWWRPVRAIIAFSYYPCLLDVAPSSTPTPSLGVIRWLTTHFPTPFFSSFQPILCNASSRPARIRPKRYAIQASGSQWAPGTVVLTWWM